MNRSLVLSFSFFLGACGAESALVGGECRAGYSAEGGRCVATAPPSPAPTAPPSSAPAAPGPAPVITTTTSPTSPTAPDATLPGEPTGPVTNEPNEPPVVTPPTTPPAPDPDPPVVVVTPEPITNVCADGFVACRGGCITALADGQNCGACGRVCPSNICVAGVCQGATPGDIVVIGHDMAQAPSFSTHAKVFTNAVSIPKTDPLRVLAFETDASAEVSAKTRALVLESNPSRSVRFGVASSPEALEDPGLYASWDVVLVDGVATTNASAYGVRWATALDGFTRQGGVLVALDDGTGDVPAFFAASNLLQLGARTSLPDGTNLHVAAPNDVVGAHLLSPYAAFGPAFGYDSAERSSNVTWVVQAITDFASPTVIHKVAR